MKHVMVALVLFGLVAFAYVVINNNSTVERSRLAIAKDTYNQTKEEKMSTFTEPLQISHPTEQKSTSNKEVATLGGGCFWCIETIFDDLKGVEKAESGYSGGHVQNPTYEQVRSEEHTSELQSRQY